MDEKANFLVLARLVLEKGNGNCHTKLCYTRLQQYDRYAHLRTLVPVEKFTVISQCCLIFLRITLMGCLTSVSF